MRPAIVNLHWNQKMSDTQKQTDGLAGSDAPTCSPSSLTPETDAMVASDLHHLEDDETCPASAYWRMVELTRTMERERDEWHYNAMRRLAVEMLSCMWCGELVHAPKGFVPGSPLTKDQRAQAYREHVSTCKKHPVREAEKLVRRLLNYADKIGPKNPTIAGQAARRDAGMWLARISPGNA